MIKEQVCNLTQSHGGGVPQRMALRICYPVSFTSRDTLVRIKLAFIEQKREHLWTIIPHCDSQQAAVTPSHVIGELAFRQTGTQPWQITICHSRALGVIDFHGWSDR